MRGLTEAVSRLRGQEGTEVRIAIMRTGESKPILKTLTRAVIKTQSVKAKMVEPGYAWIRITQFQEPTFKDFVSKLKEMNSQGQLKGLVLDLRNDPGGSLETAIGVTSAFIPRDKVVVSSRGLNSPNREYKSIAIGLLRMVGDFLAELPEIYKTHRWSFWSTAVPLRPLRLSRAHCKTTNAPPSWAAKLFGKGSVQQVMPLDRQGKTGVKLTVARYYTPSGTSLQARGVIPDIFVDDFADARTVHYSRESDLPNHLSNDSGVATDKKRDLWDEWAKEEDEPKKIRMSHHSATAVKMTSTESNDQTFERRSGAGLEKLQATVSTVGKDANKP